MKHLWPTAPRLPCQSFRTIPHSFQKLDSLVSRLNQQCSRPQSRSCLTARQRQKGCVDGSLGQDTRASLFGSLGAIRLYSSRVLTKFDQLPKDYNDSKGLAFRSTPLSDAEAKALLGNWFDGRTGTRMLRMIHGRRVAGTLLDPALRTPYEKVAWEKGLRWLRKHVPVDEVHNAGQRAEVELAELEDELIADAERIGIYRPNAKKVDNVYGEGVFDKIRKRNENRYEEELRAKENDQAEEVKQNTGTLERLNARSQVELRRQGENPRLKYYLERAKVLPDTPPDMSPFQRLWPSGLLVLGVVGGSLLLAQVYTPPQKSARIWPDVPPSAATIITIIGANAIILASWRIPPMFRMLNKFFISVPGYPRPGSLVGNIFSHQTVTHFAMNMSVLWFVGTRLHDEIGRGNFLAIYLSAGVLGSYVSLVSWVLRNNFVSASLGASGAICGIVASYLLLHSPEKVRFFGIFPPENWPSLSALAFLMILVTMDVVGLTRTKRAMTIDHMSHLGGYATGAISVWLLSTRARERQQQEEQRRRNMGIVDRIKEGKL